MGRFWGTCTTTGIAAAAATLVITGTAAVAAPAVEVEPQSDLTCHGLPVTVDQHRGRVTGTPGADVIVLTGPARVDAGRGDDYICGSPGQDVIAGGPGDDVVYGGEGDDTLRGGPGDDMVHGDLGDDALMGGAGDDRLAPGPGGDDALPGAGENLVLQGEGASFSIYMSPSDAAALRAAGKHIALATGQPGTTDVVATWVTEVESKMDFAFGTRVSGFVNGPTWNVLSPYVWTPMTRGQTLTWLPGNAASLSGPYSRVNGYRMENRSDQDGLMGIGLSIEAHNGSGTGVVDSRSVPSMLSTTISALPDRVTVFLTDGPGRVVSIPTREMRTIPLKPGDTLRFIYQEGELLQVP